MQCWTSTNVKIVIQFGIKEVCIYHSFCYFVCLNWGVKWKSAVSVCLLVVEPWKQQFHVLKEVFLDTCMLSTDFKEKGICNTRLLREWVCAQSLWSWYSLFLHTPISVYTSCLYQHSIFHRQIWNNAQQRLRQLMDWSYNHFQFLFPLGWWTLLAFCFVKSKLCPDLCRESIEASPQNERVKLRNWEVWARELQNFSSYGKLIEHMKFSITLHLLTCICTFHLHL